MKFNFPATKFVKTATMREQLHKCVSEGYEAVSAVTNHEAESFDAVCEILDGAHAYETAVRKLINEHGAEYVEKARVAVIEKNRERGYYVA